MSALVDAERAEDARRRRHEGAAEHRRLQLVAIQCDAEGMSLPATQERLGVTQHTLTWIRVTAGIAKKRETRSALLWRLRGCIHKDPAAMSAFRQLAKALRESYERD